VGFSKAAPSTPGSGVRARGNVSSADQTKSTANPIPPLGQAHRKHGVIVGRDRLIWRSDAGGFALYYGHSRRAGAYVVPDATWPCMFRVRTADGRESDMANLSRTKEAALAAALRVINSNAQETAIGGSPVRQIERAATAVPPCTYASGGER
jgi:hypothetical protein